MVTPQQLNLAGWLAVTSAVLQIPILLLSIMLEVLETGFAVRLASSLLGAVSLLLFVYIFVTLKALLGSRYDFHETDGLISALVVVNVVLVGLGLFSSVSEGATAAVGVLSLLALVPVGIVYIVFAIKLLRLQGDLYGMLKPLSYLSIATGFCFAVVVLLPIAIVTGVAVDIILAIIFFRALVPASVKVEAAKPAAEAR